METEKVKDSPPTGMLSGDDIFDGLSLDYTLLDANDPASSSLMTLPGTVSPTDSALTSTTSTVPENELQNPDQLSDVPPMVPQTPPRYHSTPYSKHKRVRSNPDALHNFLPPQPPIAPVEVTSPTTENPVGAPMPLPFSNAPTFQDSLQDMDDFLRDIPWGDNPSDDTAALLSHNREQIKLMKRKRGAPMPSHSRHHSNPVEVFQNLDQFHATGSPNGMAPPGSLPMNSPNDFNFGAQPAMPRSGQAMHSRRASLPDHPMHMGSRGQSRGHNRSTGLSMDLSNMNLSFLAVPEEEEEMPSSNMGNSENKVPNKRSTGKKYEKEGNRKLYKCGRCGQPKVGHICTMPELRNNWSQVDLEVTKGLKAMRVNCHVMPVKSVWVPQHEDHV